MEGKKIPVYLLVALVLSIWGMIIYRITSSIDHVSDGQLTNSGLEEGKARIPLIQPDTFSMLTNYPDPFEERSIAPANQVKPVLKQARVSAPILTIRYVGYIKNEVGKKRIALIHKEGKDFFMEEGASLRKMKLIAVWRDSIKVSHKGHVFFIKRDK